MQSFCHIACFYVGYYSLLLLWMFSFLTPGSWFPLPSAGFLALWTQVLCSNIFYCPLCDLHDSTNTYYLKWPGGMIAILYMCRNLCSYIWSWVEESSQPAFLPRWPCLANAAGELGFEDPFLHSGDRWCEGYCGMDYHITWMDRLDKDPVCFMTQFHNNV